MGDKSLLIFETQYAVRIKGKDADEAQARFMRILFLRTVKEELKKAGQWTEFCEKNGIDIKNADYEIGKLGDFKEEFLLKFGSYLGYDINKIKYLDFSHSEKLGVEVDDKGITYDGKLISYTPENADEIQGLLDHVIDLQKKQSKEIEQLKKSQSKKKVNKQVSKLEEEKVGLKKLVEQLKLQLRRTDHTTDSYLEAWKAAEALITEGVDILNGLDHMEAIEDAKTRQKYLMIAKRIKTKVDGFEAILRGKLL